MSTIEELQAQLAALRADSADIDAKRTAHEDACAYTEQVAKLSPAAAQAVHRGNREAARRYPDLPEAERRSRVLRAAREGAIAHNAMGDMRRDAAALERLGLGIMATPDAAADLEANKRLGAALSGSTYRDPAPAPELSPTDRAIRELL